MYRTDFPTLDGAGTNEIPEVVSEHRNTFFTPRLSATLPRLAGKTPLAYRLPPPAPRDGQQHHAILIRLIPIAKQGCCDVERPRSGTEKIPNLKAFLPRVPPDAFHD